MESTAANVGAAGEAAEETQIYGVNGAVFVCASNVHTYKTII